MLLETEMHTPLKLNMCHVRKPTRPRAFLTCYLAACTTASTFYLTLRTAHCAADTGLSMTEITRP